MMQLLPRSWARGNSTQAWSKNHDLRRCMHFDVREAQAAVDAMQHLLAKQQPVIVEAPAQLRRVRAEMSASDGSDHE